MSSSNEQTIDGIPVSDGFDFPVGPRGENVNVFESYKVDATLADPNYKKSFNAWHTGEDWNGRGGGDTDLGDPVYAISRGRVKEFGYYPPTWGNIVLLEHVLSDGTKVWSQYAHLDQIMVSQVGQIINRGQQIGTIGKGARTADKPRGRWVAHLHFEIRSNDLAINTWKPYVDSRRAVLANYYSPTPFINEHRPGMLSEGTDLANRTQIIVDSHKTDRSQGTFRKANVENWFAAPVGYQGTMLWTYAAYDIEENWAEWRPKLPSSGEWEVWAYIPEKNASTTNAQYRIVHADGLTTVPVNQSIYSKTWVPLGSFNFEPGKGYVRLSDVTGERKRGLTVGFDAIRWSKKE